MCVETIYTKVFRDLPVLEDGKNVILSLSGGLDSTTLAQLLVRKYGKERVKAIIFDYGQRHKDVEIPLAMNTAGILGIEYKLLKLDYLGDLVGSKCTLIESCENRPGTIEEEATKALASTYVPFRNLQFASIVAAFAEVNNGQYIMLGVQSDDLYSYPDTSKEYFDDFQKLLNRHRSHIITQVMPFAELTKADELRIAQELYIETGVKLKSWSCYNGITDKEDPRMCGTCATCAERLLAHIKAGESNEEIKNLFKVDDAKIDSLK